MTSTMLVLLSSRESLCDMLIVICMKSNVWIYPVFEVISYEWTSFWTPINAFWKTGMWVKKTKTDVFILWLNFSCSRTHMRWSNIPMIVEAVGGPRWFSRVTRRKPEFASTIVQTSIWTLMKRSFLSLNGSSSVLSPIESTKKTPCSVE